MADTGGPAGGSPGNGNNDNSSEGMGEGQDNTGIADAAGYGPGSTSGGTGEGRQDGPGSPTEGNPYGGPAGSSTEGTATEAGLIDGINAAIAAGLDPYSSKAQNAIAAGIMAGRFGNPESFGISVDMESPEVAGFMDQYGLGQNSGIAGLAGLIGYDPNVGFLENVANMAIPGKNTPLGAFSAVPGLMGVNDTISGIIGLANAIAGRRGAKSSSQNTGIASGSVVGKDSIAGSYGANTGIASGSKF
jgi:hypothetical protein